MVGYKIKILVKFHPILQSKYFEEAKNLNEVKDSASKLISKAAIVVTSSYTGALYESLIYGVTTCMLNYCVTDKNLCKYLKIYSNNI